MRRTRALGVTKGLLEPLELRITPTSAVRQKSWCNCTFNVGWRQLSFKEERITEELESLHCVVPQRFQASDRTRYSATDYSI